MRSERPKPLHLLCGRAMVLYVLDALADCRVDRVVVVVGHGAERVTKKLQDDERRPARSSSSSSTCSGAPATPSAVGLTGLPDDDRRRGRRDVLVLPGDTPLLRPATVAALVADAPRSPAPPARSSPRVLDDPTGYGRIVRRQGRPGRPHRRAARRRRPTSAAIDEINTSIYCFRRSLLAPALRRLQPRERPGRVLPDRRRRGAGRRRLPGGRASVADDADETARRQRPRASWPRPRPSCGGAPTTRWLRAGRHDGRPRAHLHRHHRASWPPTSPSSRARCSRAARSIGEGAEIGPDTRLVDCIGRRPTPCSSRPSAATPRSAPAPSSARSPCSSPGASHPGRDAHRAVLHCQRGRVAGARRREGAAWMLELVTKKQLHAATRAARTPRWPRRSPSTSASSSASRTSRSSPTARSTAASASRSGAPTSSSSRRHGRRDRRSTTRSWSS